MIRTFSRSLAAVLAALSCLSSLPASADRGFDPGANGNVYAVLVQPDGGVVLGGSFTTVQPGGDGPPVSRSRLARFHADGSLDATFHPALDGEVVALALQPDGRLLVAGRFSRVQPGGSGPTYPRTGLLRLEADGSLDESFDPHPTGGSPAAARVSALALQPDGRILIGGAFTALQPGAAGPTFDRRRLARLRADGTVDDTFATQANNLVLSLALQPDGRILVGGGFTTLQPAGEAAPLPAVRLARLQVDGALDASFAVHANNRVLALAVEGDGRILAGGDFTSIRGASNETDIPRSFIARFHPDGQLDGDFNPRASASVAALALQRDGQILLGGSFVFFHSVNTGVDSYHSYLARLTRDGDVDTTFRPNPNAPVAALGLQPDGRIVFGGYFSRLRPVGSTNGVRRLRVARVQPGGALDAAFATGEDGTLSALAAEPDGSLLVGGAFTNLAGLTRRNLARILPDGTIDPAFRPSVTGSVAAVVVEADGRIIVGGQFSAINGTSRRNLARLNRDGSLDAAYNPSPNGSVTALFLESDGSLLASGAFTTFDLDDGQNDDDDGDGTTTDDTSRPYFARITGSGTLASTDLNLNAAVLALVRQADGRIILGGGFSSIGGLTRTGLARLNADYSVDPTFNPAPNGSVLALTVQSDGKVVFGGLFTTLQLDDGENDDDDDDDTTTDDADRRFLARVNADGTLDRTFNPAPGSTVGVVLALPDGRILAGGSFSTAGAAAVARQNLAAFSADGAVDADLTAQANDSVTGLLRQADGRIVVAGWFTSVYDREGAAVPAASHLARLEADGTLDTGWRVRAPGGHGQRVSALGLQPDGRLVVGGSFDQLAGLDHAHLARLEPTGFADTSFTTATDGPVHAVLVQPAATVEYPSNALAWLQADGAFRPGFDRRLTSSLSGRVAAVLPPHEGAIVVGGSFSAVTGVAGHNLARILADGTPDPAFNPAPDSDVYALLRQPDGRIVVGGAFTAIGGESRWHLARLNADGTVDATFVPPALNGNVTALALQADGRLVVGGTFTAVEVDDKESDDDDGDSITTDDTRRNYLARFDSTGQLDTAYNPQANSTIAALLLEADGRLLVGGAFTTFQPNGASTTTSREYLARLNADGTVDADFNPVPNGTVTTLLRQPDGKLLVGGAFTTLQLDDGEGDDDDGDDATNDDADRRYLARLNADNTLDAAFNPRPGGVVNALLVQADHRILVAGAFAFFDPNADGAVTRNGLARLEAGGTVDATFNPNANGVVYALAAGPGGSIAVGGAFTALRPEMPLFIAGAFSTIGGQALPGLARLNIDGNPDGNFAPRPNGAVLALASHLDGTVLAGGDFTAIAGQARTYLARFSRDGALDGALAPDLDGSVTALALEPTGAALLGGNFTQVNGLARRGLARLLPGGAVDAAFAPAMAGSLAAITPLADGRILLAGDFTAVGGAARTSLARLNADGTPDPTFAPVVDGPVNSLALQADGAVVLGGGFTRVNGAPRSGLARLLPDGSLDPAATGEVDGAVHTLALTPDGNALLGGTFASLDGVPAFLVGRVGSPIAASQRFDVGTGRTSITWTLAGAAPRFSSVQFAWSADASSWTYLGPGVATADGRGWHWSGAAGLPADATYHVRARAVQPVTRGGSGGVLESSWQFYNGVPAGAGYPPLAAQPSASVPAAATAAGATAAASTIGSTPPAGTAAQSFTDQTNRTASASLTAFRTLAYVADGGTVLAEFVVGGQSSRQFLLRAIGPGLAGSAITDHLPGTAIRLTGSSGRLLAERTGGPDSTTVQAAESRLGLAAATAGDTALVVELAPGAYALAVRDPGAGRGFVLVEVHAADPSTDAALSAFATGGPASGGAEVTATEFILGGIRRRTLLARAQGGVPPEGAISAPLLTVLSNGAGGRSSGATLSASAIASLGTDRLNAGRVAAALAGIGMAAAPDDGRWSTKLADLPPGTHELQATPADPNAGVERIEVYEVAAEAAQVPGAQPASR